MDDKANEWWNTEKVLHTGKKWEMVATLQSLEFLRNMECKF